MIRTVCFAWIALMTAGCSSPARFQLDQHTLSGRAPLVRVAPSKVCVGFEVPQHYFRLVTVLAFDLTNDEPPAPDRITVLRSSGFPYLDNCFVAAMRYWRFHPRDGGQQRFEQQFVVRPADS